jgi:hypothetical protein
MCRASSSSWLYGSWIYNNLCNQYLSPLKLFARIPLMTRCNRYNIMWSSLLVLSDDRSVAVSGCDLRHVGGCLRVWLTTTGRWLSPDVPVFSSNKTDFNYITEILLKEALSTIFLALYWKLLIGECNKSMDITPTCCG